MNEPFSGESSSADAPTPEQAAALRYLSLAPDGSTTRAQAGALIARAEADPATRETFRAWHRDKLRLHPDLFAPPQRSLRESRWWQARISDGGLYGDSFQQPSLEETSAVLAALDRREPGWDHESGPRREARFMNELAALCPELCKPGCAFPSDLPEEGAPAQEQPPATPATRAPVAFAAPSAPFVPDQYAAVPPTFQAPSQPAWQPPVQLPAPASTRVQETDDGAADHGGGGAWKWGVLALALAAAGVGAYAYFGFRPPALERGTDAKASSASAPSLTTNPTAPTAVAATASRQRAVARYPDLAKAGTALNAKFIVTYRELEAAHDPLLQQPDWPERLAARCADALAASKAPHPKPAANPTPAPSQVAAAAPTPAPAATPAVTRTTNVSGPSAPAAPGATPFPVPPAAKPAASPAAHLFVTLDAVPKSRMNNYTYHWSPYYYADYDISFRQAVGVEVKVRNMAKSAVTVNLRWMFFGRKTANNERYVFSASQKRVELAPGQTVADVLDSPMLQSSAAVSYSYGTHYYSGSKYEGWLVQVLPEGEDKVLSQVGSSGYIEDYGKRADLTTLLKEQLKQ